MASQVIPTRGVGLWALVFLLIASSPILSEHDKTKHAVRTAARVTGVDPDLLQAICTVESDLNAREVNYNDGGQGNNSVGVCQVMVSTAVLLGWHRGVHDWCNMRLPENKRIPAYCSLYDPYVNAQLAGRYLHYLLERYHGDTDLAIAAYNYGDKIKVRSDIRPISWQYIRAVRKHLMEGK